MTMPDESTDEMPDRSIPELLDGPLVDTRNMTRGGALQAADELRSFREWKVDVVDGGGSIPTDEVINILLDRVDDLLMVNAIQYLHIHTLDRKISDLEERVSPKD